jgi:hypothetical protein
MAPTPFLQTLAAEVARMQAAHPEREGELARASALILHGLVVPSPTDPATGQVLSSDAQTTYTVNGTCSCQAGQHGKGCKHLQAWKLYQYVVGKLAAQEPQASAPSSQASGETSHGPDASTALPEAPASVNCHLTIAGRQVQLTLRDSDEGRLLQRLAAVLAQYPAPQPPAPTQGQPSPQQHNAAAMHRPVTGFCPVHNVAMQEQHKNGRTWWSHRTADGWCKGR